MIVSPEFKTFAGRFYDMPPTDSKGFEPWIDSKISAFSAQERTRLKSFLSQSIAKETDLVMLRDAWRDAGAVFTFPKSADVSSFFQGVISLLK